MTIGTYLDPNLTPDFDKQTEAGLWGTGRERPWRPLSQASCRSHRRSPGPNEGVLGLYDKWPSERFLCLKLSELEELHSAQRAHMLLSNFFCVNPKCTLSSPSPPNQPLPSLAWTAQLPPDWPPHFTAASSFPSRYR